MGVLRCRGCLMRRRNGRGLAGCVCLGGRNGIARADDTQQKQDDGGCEQDDNSVPASHQASFALKQQQLTGGGKGAMLAVGMAFAGIVGIVAPLAECGQVVFGIVGRVVVEVRGGQDDPAAGLGMGPAVGGVAPFAASPGALETDAPGDLGPVGRVEGLHRWMNRHWVSFGCRLPACVMCLSVRSVRTVWPWPIGPRPRGGCSGPASLRTASGRSP